MGDDLGFAPDERLSWLMRDGPRALPAERLEMVADRISALDTLDDVGEVTRLLRP